MRQNKFYLSSESSHGFTIVEIAIVMIVVGLLSVLILKGSEIIENSRVTSTISEMENVFSAVNTFQDNYGVYPGDMANANFRIPNCNAGTCNNGNGNGLIDVAIGAENTITSEGAYLFGQLRAVELLTNYDGANTPRFGNAFPSAPIGGGYIVGDTGIGAATGFDETEMRNGPYIILVNINEDVDADTGTIRPSQAETIDRILDNGRPDTGAVIGQTTADSCRNTATPVGYAENQDDQLCVIAYRLPSSDLF